MSIKANRSGWVDETDRALLRLLQSDATRPYSELAAAVNLSPGAVHERVRKLRDRHVIARTTVDVDPEAVGAPVLAFVTLRASAWMGDAQTHEALEAIEQIEEAHIIAGAGSILLKIRARSTKQLQNVLRQLFDIPGVDGTDTTVVLESMFQRPLSINPSGGGG